MKIGKTIPVLIIGTVITVQLRIFSLGIFGGSSPSANNSLLSAWSVSAVFFSMLILLMSLAAGRYPQYPPTRVAPLMGLAAFAASAAVGWNSIAGLVGSPGELNAVAVLNILGLCAALALFLLGINFLAGNNLIERMPMVLAFPAIWMGLRLTLLFIYLSDLADFGEKSADLIVMALLLVFLISSAKFLSASGDKAVKTVYAVGGPAALAALAVNLPRCLLMFDIPGALAGMRIPLTPADENLIPQMPDLALGLYAFALLAHIVIRGRVGEDD
ncbi:MAG: hypothetical protein FWE86_04390 [Oscillospiraceae bacterium]|nr:hypothetical protein [Oscillospiraceae bacterium]